MMLEIPSSVQDALPYPAGERERFLRLELALALYQQEALSLGMAAELAGIGRIEFGRVLGERQIPRHIRVDDLRNDAVFARH